MKRNKKDATARDSWCGLEKPAGDTGTGGAAFQFTFSVKLDLKWEADSKAETRKANSPFSSPVIAGRGGAVKG